MCPIKYQPAPGLRFADRERIKKPCHLAAMSVRRLPPITLVAMLSLALIAGSRAAPPLSFNRDIRPILSENCYQCHGFDASTRKGKRRIDTFDGATAERNGIRAIVPRDPEASELWMRIISRDEDEVMPPPDTHKSLTAEQKDKLRRWISEGAVYERHWAFIPPPDTVLPPAVKNTAWPRSDIDRF